MEFRKEVLINVVLAAIAVVLSIFYIYNYNKEMGTVVPTPKMAENQSIDISSHNNNNDCWVIVDAEVYDVTSYLDKHPAGADKIIPLCGEDATIAFDGIKGGKGHSPNAKEILKEYKVNIK